MGRLITPEEVVQKIPGMTKNKLSQLRFKGQGPNYYKPTPKTVVYDEEVVDAWFETTLQGA